MTSTPRRCLPPRRPALAAAGLVLAVWLTAPTDAQAWPAVQDGTGVHLCDRPPTALPDGRWTCRSGGYVFEGTLVDVSRGPYGPPGTGRGYGPGARGPYGPYAPYGPPPRGGSGYDELGPWLGGSGPSER